MDIRISGHQVATGDALKDHVSDRLQGIATKHFERAISAEVTFGKGPHDVGFRCDIVVHVMQPAVRTYYNIEELWTGTSTRPKGKLLRAAAEVSATEEEAEPTAPAAKPKRTRAPAKAKAV